jgi:hypothetical protein
VKCGYASAIPSRIAEPIVASISLADSGQTGPGEGSLIAISFGTESRRAALLVDRQVRHNRRVLKATGLLAAAMLLIGSGVAYSRSQAHPTTLVWAKGEIVAFAQDGDQIAWASYSNSVHSHCIPEIRIRLLDKHRAKLVGCGVTGGDGKLEHFSLAGRRVLWKEMYCGNFCYQQLATASYSKRERVLFKDELVWDPEYRSGDSITAAAGDSSTLIYGVATYSHSGGCGEDSTGPCITTVEGSTNRVTNTGTAEVPGAGVPNLLAVSGRRIALTGWDSVAVIDAVTGAHVGSFSSAEGLLDVAFAPSVVAVLESAAGGRRIEFHSLAGALIRTVAVPAKATDLSTNNTRAVFRVGKSIRTVRVAAGVSNTVATAQNVPIGLSIEGTRVAWAENVKIHGVQRGRIRAITVR